MSIFPPGHSMHIESAQDIQKTVRRLVYARYTPSYFFPQIFGEILVLWNNTFTVYRYHLFIFYLSVAFFILLEHQWCNLKRKLFFAKSYIAFCNNYSIVLE